jgi:hypothetical protein
MCGPSQFDCRLMKLCSSTLVVLLECINHIIPIGTAKLALARSVINKTEPESQ